MTGRAPGGIARRAASATPPPRRRARRPSTCAPAPRAAAPGPARARDRAARRAIRDRRQARSPGAARSTSISTSSGRRVEIEARARVRRRGVLERVRRCWPGPSPPRRRRRTAPRTPAGSARSAGSNSGSSEYEVAADEVGRCAAATVADDGRSLPRQRVEQRRRSTRTRPAPSPPMVCWSPYGSTITSPCRPSGARRRRPRPSRSRERRCGTGSGARRPGAACRPAPAASTRTRTRSVSSDRKKIAPSRRSCSSAACSRSGVPDSTGGASVMVTSVRSSRILIVTDTRRIRPGKEVTHDELSPSHPRRAHRARPVGQRPRGTRRSSTPSP